MHAIRVLRWLRWSREPDYEEELPRLSKRIAEARMRLLTAGSRQRRWPFLFLVQAIAIYVTYVATVVRMSLHLHPRHMVALTLAPPLIFAVYKSVSRLTAWRKGQVDAQLQLLTAKRKKLVEDYKKKTNYEKIQRLIGEGEEDNLKGSNVSGNAAVTHSASRSGGESASGYARARVPPKVGWDSRRPQESARSPLPSSRADGSTLPASLIAPEPVPVYHTSWVDRVLDLLVGENELGPDSRLALICSTCHVHNGLAPGGKAAEEVIYKCRSCGFENNAKSADADKEPEVVGAEMVVGSENTDKAHELGEPQDESKIGTAPLNELAGSTGAAEAAQKPSDSTASVVTN